MTQPVSHNIDALTEEIKHRVSGLSDAGVPTVRRIRQDIFKHIAGFEPPQVIALALGLSAAAGLRWFAYELVHFHRATLNRLDAAALERLGQDMDSWGSVDPFALYLAGPAWREHQVPDSLILSWARSEDRWWRRAALASTVALNNQARGGAGDPELTLAVCRLLVADPDDVVVKALSWALRELIRHDPSAVRRFLEEHEDSLSARVRREVRNKLTTGLKNPRRRCA